MTQANSQSPLSLPMCPLCGQQPLLCGKAPVKKAHNKYRILYCPSCDFSFSDPMEQPDKEWYENSPIYREHKITGNPERLWFNHPKKRMDWRTEKIAVILRRTFGNFSGIKSLDIGCGDGGLIEALKTFGFTELYGIDINSAAVKKAQAKGLDNIIRGDFRDLRNIYRKETFDMVTMFEVLEHSSDPVGLLGDAAYLLKKGGYIFISVPNLRRKPRLFDEELDSPPHHLTLWSKNAIENALVRAGFARKEIEAEIKPLEPAELIFHIIRRIKKILRHPGRKISVNKNDIHSKATDEESAAPSGENVSLSRLRFIAWKFIFIAGIIAAFLFGLIHRDGGFTIFASARKN